MTRQRAISSALGCGLLIASFQFAPGFAKAEPISDARIADIVKAGKLRVGIGLANLVSGVKDSTTGELRGVSVDIARALAATMKVEFQAIEYPRPGLVLSGARNNAWDVAFLVIDSERAADADFSAAYMESDFTLLVPAGSAIRNFAEADKPGIRIGVPRGDAVDLRLTRIAKQAELVRVDDHAAGADLLRTGRIAAYAAPRPALLGMSARLSGSHVLDDSIATISFAAFVPKGHGATLAYVVDFLEGAKSSGLVSSYIERAGLRGMNVAPPAKSTAIVGVQQADPRVADLVRAGRIRVALHLAQYAKDPVSGELRGLGSGTVMVQVANALAARLGIKTELIGYPSPPAVEECLRIGACDLGFGGVKRAATVSLTPPFLQLDYTYLVPAGSSIRSVADADQPGVRVAVVRNHLSTLALGRILRHVEPVASDVPEASFDLLRTGQVDAFASTRPVLLAYSSKLPGSRVLEDRYGANLVAMAVAKDHPEWLGYFSEFIEESKRSGFVQQAIEHVGERGIRVAPPEKN